MGFGVLEDNKLPHVPGTVLLDQEAAHSESYTQSLKHGTGHDSHIILVPQPSDDPNDPLNWSQYRKTLVFSVYCFGSILYACVNVFISMIDSEGLGYNVSRGHSPRSDRSERICNRNIRAIWLHSSCSRRYWVISAEPGNADRKSLYCCLLVQIRQTTRLSLLIYNGTDRYRTWRSSDRLQLPQNRTDCGRLCNQRLRVDRYCDDFRYAFRP